MRSEILVLVCICGAAFAADRIVGGPYVVNPNARSATIGWVVESGEVQMGTAPGEATRTVPVLHSEKVSMTGLKPGQTVYYEIPGDGPAAERRGSFKTPPSGAVNYQFVVFGDTRTRDELHRRVVQAIAKTDPDFVLHTGDLVADGYDTAQWPKFFEIEGDMLRKTVFFPVLGNHERDNARFHEFFDVKDPYYSFNWGSAHFALIDSDVANYASGSAARERFWTEQTRWLEEDLEKSQNAALRFVVMHHPPLTVNHRSEAHVSKETAGLTALLEREHVTAVLAGHDHNYQHHLKNGVHYIITGGGGAPLAPADPPLSGITLKVESVEHYVRIRVEGSKAHVEAVALDGHMIDSFDLGQ